MSNDHVALAARLAKLQALFERAGSSGERDAAGAAIARLRDQLGAAAERRDGSGEVELKFSLPDIWSVRLFIALCRKHGLRPYRYARQRRTTVQIRADERFVTAVLWPEFSELQTALEVYFQETVDHLIAEAMRSDGDDSELETDPRLI